MEHAVAGIAKAWNDIANIIQVAVHNCGENWNFRQNSLEIPDAFRGGEQAKHPYICGSTLFENLAGSDRRACRGQHWIKNDTVCGFVDLGDLVVIFNRFESCFVPV